MSKLENQFYKDNAPNFEEFKVLGALFDSLSCAFDDIITQSIDNSKISTMRTFTTIPMQTINIVDACYSLSTILTNKELLNIVDIDPSNTMQERIDAWNNLNPKIRAVALDQLGLVLMLVNPNTLKGGEDTYMDTFKVIDFEMYDQSTGDKLIFGLDYYYEFNKIYFLRFGAQTNKYNNKKVVLKNIVIDTNNPEKVLGESLGIYANSNFSPTEYRDVITSFASAALAGPVVGRINQSFNPDANLLRQTKSYGLLDNENALKGVTVVDYKSADSVRKRFWDLEVEGSRRLNGFDFLVVTPIEYLYRTEKIEYVQEFVKMIKPAQSSFVICPEIIFKDLISMRYSKFSFNMSGEMTGIFDKLTHIENTLALASNTTEDEITKKAESVYNVSINKIRDLIEMSSLSQEFTLESVTNYFDNILYIENEFKIGYLKASDRIHIKGASGAGDDVYLDVDYFDSVILSDYFNTTVIVKLEDNIPHLKTGSFDMRWMKQLNDNIKYLEHSKNILCMSASEKTGVTRLYNNERALKTDNDEICDELRFDDSSARINPEIKLKNNLDLKDSDNGLALLNTGILYDKISNREGNEITTFQNKADKIRFASTSNIVICDSCIEYDYDGVSDFKLDIAKTPNDEQADVYEVVAIKLIPKEG